MKSMYSKLSWISFIPFALLVPCIKLLQTLGVHLPFDNVTLSYSAVALVLIMFFINIIFCIIDRKTSPVYILTPNIPASVFALLTATFITAKSVLTIIQEIRTRHIAIMYFLISVIGVVAAISLVFFALAHLQGRNFPPRMAAMFLSLPAWSCLSLICEFLVNRTTSTLSIDPISLFSYAFSMIFLFKVSMIICTIDGKNPIKSSFLYGFPLAVLGFGYGVKTVCGIIVEGLDFSENSVGITFFFMAMYVVFVNIELTKNAKSKLEQTIEYDLGDIDENSAVYGMENGEEYYVSPSDNDEGDYYYESSVRDAEDFVTEVSEYTPIYEQSIESVDDYIAIPDNENDDDDVIYVDTDTAETFENHVVSPEVADKETPIKKSEKMRLEEIDKLISDIDTKEE